MLLKTDGRRNLNQTEPPMTSNNSSGRQADVNPARILDMASAFYESAILFAASDLGIFSTLARLKSANCRTVAGECGLDSRGIRLLMDGCVAVGLLNKTGDKYSNTDETTAFLVPGSPGDLSKAIRYNRDVYPAWGLVSQLAKTGKPVEQPAIHLGENPERTRAFVLSMHGRALGIGRLVVPQLDLKNSRKLLDVGGGPGTYSVLIAKANPTIQCIVLDLPEVAAIASELIASENMQAQVKTLPGDYHETPFPAGNDTVNFFGVLHQEEPDSIRKLLKKAYNSLLPGGAVNILDMMTDSSHTSPKFSALFAVNMALTTNHGWVFSDSEIETWLAEAGFTKFKCGPMPPPMPHWLATAVRE